MDSFINWEMLTTYTSFVSIVYMVVEFTKNLKYVKKIPTQYWSWFVAFILLTITNVVVGSFKVIDIILYGLSAMAISLGANGLSNFNKKEDGRN